MRRLIHALLKKLGYRIQKIYGVPDEVFEGIHEKVRLCTMTSKERQHALFDAVAYLVDTQIQGDIVECGVWKGGSSMVAALTLMHKGDTSRKLYLYDTYTGMTEPTEEDINFRGVNAKERWESLNQADHNEWDYAPLEEVEQNVQGTGYPVEQLLFVKGKVEETIPNVMPEKIALLRLDTDWYESTKHELEHLFPRLVSGGVLILDDYGHWDGARKAVDEYLKEKNIRILLNRIDYSGRIGVKIEDA